MKIHRLNTPLDSEQIKQLKAGDKVLISGTIYTARDAAHKRMIQLLAEGKELPMNIKGQIVYYVGPAQLLDLGLKGMIGKGSRSEVVIDSIIKNQAVYFVAIGGAAVVMAEAIKAVEIIAWEDLGTEALRKLEIIDLPCFVGIDSSGNDVFEIERKKYKINED